MTRRIGRLMTGLLVVTVVASSHSANAAETDIWPRGLGEPRVGGLAAYGPLGGLRATAVAGPAAPTAWRMGYRFADRWWAGLHMETETAVPGPRMAREGLATLAGQYDFSGAYGLKPYLGAAASFRAQPSTTRLVDSGPLEAWLRLGVDYRLAQGLHSYFEIDSAYLKRGVDGVLEGQTRQNVGETLRDTLQWRTGLLYRF